MKIALLTDGIYPYVMGGMQKHSYSLCKYLAQAGVYVDLFHFNQSDLEANELECFSIEEKKYINATLLEFPKTGKLPGHYIRESYKYSELIFDQIKNKLQEYDFIYAKGFSAWKLIEEKKKGVKCPPIGVKFHGYEMFQKAPSLKVKTEHLLLRNPVKYNTLGADVVFSYGGRITQIVKELGVSSSKIIELPTGIEEHWLNKTKLRVNNPLKFVFVGRYERRKGIEELTEAIKQLLPKIDSEFHFIGPIPTKKRIDNSQVIYHGSIREQNEIKGLLQQMDVLVCPSYSEGMPNVIMEGMASGVAIIATNVGAVSEMVSRENGILMDECSVINIKSAIINFIKQKEEIVSKKQNSFQKVEKQFLWKRLINQLLKDVIK